VTPQRADARANRAALLASAARLFSEIGGDVPLDAVASDAGVSIATLYRHFPDRTALVAEVYRHEIEQLGDVSGLLESGDAAAALTRWMAHLVDYAETKQTLSEVLHALPAGERPSARTPIVTALDVLLAAGAADGSLRSDLDAEDLLSVLAGVWAIAPGPEWRTRAERLAAFVVQAMRTSD
jgi:AcrR family transcriptional regulator